MKQNNNKIGVGLLLLALGLFAACKKFVEIPSPTTQLVTVSVFNNNASATSALTAIYTQMFNNQESFNISNANGLLSDELTNYSTNPPNTQFYTNSMTAKTGSGEWVNAYSYIYQANAIIAAIKNSGTLTPSVGQQLTGEAEFIRAFWHFYLTNCYGDVPLVTTTNYTINEAISRTPKAQVFQQIIADLQDAQSRLSNNYVDASDTSITTQRVRPTKWAAAALLARVFLYNSNYTNAASEATSVINNSALFSLDTLNGVFLANSTEAIWQISTPSPANDYNTYDGYYYILLAAPGGSQTNTISPELISSFEPGDLRFADWVDSISIAGQTYHFPYKYKVSNSNNLTEYTMVFRLAEQYLIRSEAEAELGNTSAATVDLNIIRNRAGLKNTTAATKTDLLAAIMHERQVELFTEWGNRWFDLVRFGEINSVMGSPGNVCQSKGGTWKLTDNLYPIPQNDRIIDGNLSQNPGY